MSPRIVVIDDTQEILDLFLMILESEGYEVVLEKQMFEHVTDIERLHPDVIVLDFLIGTQKQGWEMLQKLKMYPPTASIPLIICTAALNEVREQEDYLQAKGIRVVFKPFDIDELLQAVQQALPSTAG